MDNDKYIGRLLDNRYEVLEVIGVGGMAVVYKARCHRLNRLVAIKILKDEYSKDEEFCHRFHAEGQAVAMVGHPNIVSVYDVSTSHDADYIVMELIDGISLKQYMEKKGVLNWKETLHFAIQIGKALEHAHSRGIVHRDIKPHNVMVLKNGSVKVTDFGIARVMSESHTLTREALGSVHYISPEQAKGGRVDNRSDIYSLGVVMYEMMTGRPPYNGESPVAVAIQHINGGAPMPTTLNPNIPGGLEQIIMKAMAHDPAERYSGATAMLYDMDEFRKNPVILFDYNAPPTDAVINLPNTGAAAASAAGAAVQSGTGRSPVVGTDRIPAQTAPRTTADRVVSEKTEQPANRTAAAGAGAAPVRRRQDGTAPRNTSSARRPAQSGGQRRRNSRDEEDNRMATIAVIACSAVAVIALVIFLVLLVGGGCVAGNGDLIEVPDLLGEDFEQIQKQYAYNQDIYIKLNTEQESSYSDTYEKGQIMKQNPAAGTDVPKGSEIRVTISKGKEPPDKYMSQQIGKSVDEAKGFLDGLDMELQVEVLEEVSDTVEKGLVIRTDPAEGERINPGDVVILYVSSGPEIIELEMEDVTDKTVDEAKKWLDNQKLNLTIEVEEEENLEVEEGTILRTKPAKGETLKTGDTVIIYVATGMKTDYMPSVAGMTLDEAKKKLADLQKDLNLTIKEDTEYDANVAEGKVVRTDPAYNERVKTGDTVTIYVCGKKTAQMPNVVGKDVDVAIELLNLKGFHNIKYDEKKASNQPKDTVLTQSVDKDEEIPVDTEIVLVLSKGSGTTTKKHTFGLMEGMTEDYDVRIVNKQSGAVVYQGTVKADQSSVTVELTGSGKQTYEIYINDIPIGDYGDVTVDFDA